MTRLMPNERTLPPATSAIDALAAPARDGAILVEPAVDRMMADARANRALRQSYDFTLLDRPASEWLAERTREDAPLVVMSGHQPEFFHPGVWIKHVFATRLAEQIGGEAHFLVVDSDVPVVVRLEWPVIREDGFATIENARAASVMDWRSYEYIRDRKGIDYAALFEPARKRFGGGEATPLDAFADAMVAPQVSGTYVDRWLAALTACDAFVGVPDVRYNRISRCFGFGAADHDPAAAALAAHVVINAHEFRLAYNGALSTYRARRNIAGTQHPIPDLAEDDERIETPFWLTNPKRGRARLYATPCRSADCVTLFAGNEALSEISTRELIGDPARALAAALGDWAIRPRALAQTMYARIFACDLFLHGIGGAKYDQVTDDLIRDFFDAAPPAYGCVSATLRLSLPRFDATPAALSETRRALRDLAYNPQRYLDDAQAARFGRDLAERQEAIAESDRLREDEPGNRPARKAAFDRIHAANHRLGEALTDRTAATKERVAQLSRELDHNRIASNRAWFFALYTAQQLRALRDAAWRAVDAAAL